MCDCILHATIETQSTSAETPPSDISESTPQVQQINATSSDVAQLEILKVLRQLQENVTVTTNTNDSTNNQTCPNCCQHKRQTMTRFRARRQTNAAGCMEDAITHQQDARLQHWDIKPKKPSPTEWEDLMHAAL